MRFKLESEFTPKGDQPQAIEKLSRGIEEGKKRQVLLGITGSGKTYTMAEVIARVQKPTLVLAHNKTLAAQLFQEFKGFFPKNAVEYFVSYYDYYQPEAYIARTDTYIEKDMAINEQIERMRLSATRSLIERDDVVIVSSVSCIYGLGSPENYRRMVISLSAGMTARRDDLLMHLIELRYTRTDDTVTPATFRVRGDILEIMPAYEEDRCYRIEFFDDVIEKMGAVDPLTRRLQERLDHLKIYPGSHYVTPEEVRYEAIETIRSELEERVLFFEERNAHLERQRILERTRYDMEMIKEIGFCKGIENYSRHFSGRGPGEPPPTLIDYFPDDFLLFIDESHQTLPQVRAMYNGDRSRKTALIEFGFRLPSAFDNRPLKFEEFYEKMAFAIYVSATPAPFEIQDVEGEIVEQIVRPTGLLDPEIEVRKAEFQVDDAIEEILKEAALGRRTLVTTLTKKLAEELSQFLGERGLKAKYLHSDIDTVERIQIIKELRSGIFDVLVGINLLREGLDIPEVSLVLVLDADREGFLRSETALIQTCGRAARNEHGRVILYADTMTRSIVQTVEVTRKRRLVQQAYNEEHGIVPHTVRRAKIESLLETVGEVSEDKENLTAGEISKRMREAEHNMNRAAKQFLFEEAARQRDLFQHYQKLLLLEDHLD
ncbi:MAG: excinuclease ABC subunit B [Chlamydiae bacterium RIFCSPHIGHO2_12_FULL_49_11]|nr:MAG: excinuclease ABC subunit B [Chlamydiae bacterium RIFCSPHIGHO2_12_FULL_49_11]